MTSVLCFQKTKTNKVAKIKTTSNAGMLNLENESIKIPTINETQKNKKTLEYVIALHPNYLTETFLNFGFSVSAICLSSSSFMQSSLSIFELRTGFWELNS